MRVLPYLTVFIKLFTSTDISKIILYRGYFFLLCDCCPLGPYFQNGADHWREIGMSLNCRVSEGFSVPATQAKVISEATWFPKWRWLATADLKIYPIQFFTSGMGLLPCKNPNVYLGPVSFFFFFHIAPQPQAIFQFSATELNPGRHIVTSESAQLWQCASWTLLVPPYDWTRAQLTSSMLCMAKKAVLKTAKGQ